MNIYHGDSRVEFENDTQDESLLYFILFSPQPSLITPSVSSFEEFAYKLKNFLYINTKIRLECSRYGISYKGKTLVRNNYDPSMNLWILHKDFEECNVIKMLGFWHD